MRFPVSARRGRVRAADCRPAARRFPLTLIALLLVGALAACSGPDGAPTPLATATVAPTVAAPPTETIAPPTETATEEPTATPTPTEAATDTPIEEEASPEDTTEPSETANEDTPTEGVIDQTQLADAISALIDEAGGTVEAVVETPDGEMLYDYNSSESMESASLYKLGVMVELYRAREAGELSFDDTLYMYPGFFAEGEDAYSEADIGAEVPIGDLLHAMITVSSNVAASALLDRLGNENINATLASLGLAGTEIRWMPGHDLSQDDGGLVLAAAHPNGPAAADRQRADARADASLNVTTAADVASLCVQLLNGEVVSPGASQEMLDLLAEQQVNDRLPALLPDGTVVAHKTGNLDGLVHDAGVIYAPNGPIVVAVLTEDLDDDVANDLIARIALLAYEFNS